MIDALMLCFGIDNQADLLSKERERKMIGRVLPFFAEDLFTAAEWNAALSFLYGVPLRFHNVVEAKAFMRRNPLEINTRKS